MRFFNASFLYVDPGFWPILFSFFLKMSLNISSKAGLVAEMEKNLPVMQETWVWPLGRKISWRREWLSTPVFLPWKSHGQSSLSGFSPWYCRVGDNWAAKHIWEHKPTGGSFTQGLSKKIFIYPSLLNNKFDGYRILGGTFSFNSLYLLFILYFLAWFWGFW